jgi:hypothetical protein
VVESTDRALRRDELREDGMRRPDEVARMLRLRDLGWGERRVAAAVGCNRRTVRRYLVAEGWVGYRVPRRSRRLEGLDDWLAERLRQHRGNAEVVRRTWRGRRA